MTKILAIFLGFCAVGLICAGGFGIYTGNKERSKDLKELSDMKSWAEYYRELDIKLDGESKADEMDRHLKSESESHDEASSEHRRELAEYSAAKSGLQMGSDALIQGDEKLAQGWEQYYKALDTFTDKEREFNEGYAQFEAGKAALAASKALYDGAVQALEGAKVVVSELEALDEIFASGDMEEVYDRLLTAYEGGIYAISEAESAVNDMLSQGLITQEQLQAIENEIIAATGMSTAEIKAKVQADYDSLLNNGGITEEQFNALKAVYDQNKAALNAVALNIKKYIAPAEDKLSSMGTEIQKAQAEIDKMEPYMEQGKTAIVEGKKGLEQAEQVLIQSENALFSSEKQIDAEQGKLNDKLPQLKEQKQSLENEQAELGELKDQTEERKTLEGKRTSLSLKLRSKAPIRESYENGTELYEASLDYIAQFEKEIGIRFRNQIVMMVIMSLAGIAGLCSPIFIFRKNCERKKRLMIPAACALISIVALIFGYFGLDIVSSSTIIIICASAALILSAYQDKKKQKII